MYSCHLFLISSASVRSIPFLSFIEPVFAWNIPLICLIFLKRSLVFPILCFPLFLCIDRWGRLSYLSWLFFGIFHSNGYIFPFLLCFSLLFFSQLFVRPPQTTILPFYISFPWGWSWSLSPVQCHEPPCIVHQALCLSDLVPKIYFSLPLYSHKGFDLDHTEWSSGFPFLQFESEFDNKEFKSEFGKITADGDCSHEIKRCLLLGRKVMTNLNSVLKSQRHYFANKGPFGQGYGFSSGHVWMWELDYKESWVLKNWCFWTIVLEMTLESPLDCKEIQPVHPKGDQSWVFLGRTDAEAETPVLWPPHAKSWLIGQSPDAGRGWGREEKGTTEDKMVGWHHRLDGHGYE